jgi:hypothetical protein
MVGVGCCPLIFALWCHAVSTTISAETRQADATISSGKIISHSPSFSSLRRIDPSKGGGSTIGPFGGTTAVSIAQTETEPFLGRGIGDDSFVEENANKFPYLDEEDEPVEAMEAAIEDADALFEHLLCSRSSEPQSQNTKLCTPKILSFSNISVSIHSSPTRQN